MTKLHLILGSLLFLSIQVILLMGFYVFVNGRIINLEIGQKNIVDGVNAYIENQKNSPPSAP